MWLHWGQWWPRAGFSKIILRGNEEASAIAAKFSFGTEVDAKGGRDGVTPAARRQTAK
jgi:hypothetical protein